MKDQHEKIKGYRNLSQEEINLMNEGKALAEQCGIYIEKLMADEGTDKRAVALGRLPATTTRSETRSPPACTRSPIPARRGHRRHRCAPDRRCDGRRCRASRRGCRIARARRAGLYSAAMRSCSSVPGSYSKSRHVRIAHRSCSMHRNAPPMCPAECRQDQQDRRLDVIREIPNAMRHARALLHQPSYQPHIQNSQVPNKSIRAPAPVVTPHAIANRLMPRCRICFACPTSPIRFCHAPFSHQKESQRLPTQISKPQAAHRRRLRGTDYQRRIRPPMRCRLLPPSTRQKSTLA